LVISISIYNIYTYFIRILTTIMSSGRVVNSQYDTKEATPSTINTNNHNQSDFVNTGYENWLQIRQQWRNAPPAATNQPTRTRPVDPDEILDRLTRGNGGGPIHLPYPVPLETMVEVLMEIWEEEGLYG
jgi:hypothetical protein